LESAIRENLTPSNIEDFGTPNSDRVMDFISKPDGEIILTGTEVSAMQQELNTRGHSFLAEKIKKIR
jgi:hypothetical protein